MEITLGYSEYDDVWFAEPTDSQSTYLERLQKEVDMAVMPLIPYLSEISSIRSYSDLLLVDKSILTLLETFELARVELNEGYDHGVFCRTSGHHKDYLDIYQDALNGRKNPRTNYICLSDGQFDLVPIEIISTYLVGLM